MVRESISGPFIRAQAPGPRAAETTALLVLFPLDLQDPFARRFVLAIQIRPDSLEFVVGLEQIQSRIFRSQHRIGKSAVGQQVVEVPISVVEAILKPVPDGEIKTHPSGRLSRR